MDDSLEPEVLPLKSCGLSDLRPVRGEHVEDGDREELIVRFARLHAGDWKRASKTNAEIIYQIFSNMRKHGYSQEAAFDIAAHTLRYMERSFSSSEVHH
ncbi:MAG TPA: hypothetical protein VKH45_05135 [Candidatus Acidoferrum sp.]|nr:hypothetical protein [Candidatus Acidoferrum sp.]